LGGDGGAFGGALPWCRRPGRAQCSHGPCASRDPQIAAAMARGNYVVNLDPATSACFKSLAWWQGMPELPKRAAAAAAKTAAEEEAAALDEQAAVAEEAAAEAKAQAEAAQQPQEQEGETRRTA
jgi:hypothetical protein